MIIDITVTNPQNNKSATCAAKIDTGADCSAICVLVAESLGLKHEEWTTILDADGSPMDVPVYTADIAIGQCRIRNARIIGLDLQGTGYTSLIGEDILRKGILINDGPAGKWRFYIGDDVCATGEDNSLQRLLLAGFLGAALGVTGALLLTRK